MGPGNGCRTFWCTPAPQRRGDPSSKGSALSPFCVLAGNWCWGNNTVVFTAGFTYSSTTGGFLSLADLQRKTDCSDHFPADARTALCKRTRAQLNLCVNEGGSCEHGTGMCGVPAQLWSTFLLFLIFMLGISPSP